jgi:hypothetical protein
MLSDRRGFGFDIACLINHQPEQIGSRYRPVVQDESASVAVCVDPKCSRAEQLTGGEWMIGPREMFASLPSTVRWQYQLRSSE